MTHSRRQFLKNSACGLSAALAGISARGRIVHAAETTQKHLVNFVIRGGWDSHWSTTPVSTSEAGSTGGSDSSPLAGALSTSTAFRRSSSSNDITEAADEFTGSNSSNGAAFHIRYPDAQINTSLFSGGGVGPLLSHWSSSTASRVHIVRGLQAEGGHDIGNTANQHGTSGSSTPSFSATVAYAEATRLGASKPLHRVVAGSSLSSVLSSNGNLGGPANAVFIPSASLFTSLFSSNTNDPFKASSTRRAYLDAAISKLSTELGSSRLSLLNSQDAFTSFLSAFNGVYTLFGLEGSGTHPLTTKTTEYTAILQAIVNTSTGHLFAKDWFHDCVSREGTRISNAISSLAFQFALAELLIEQNLSSVIDLVGVNHDNHNGVDLECLMVLLEMEAMKTLIERLSALSSSDGTGRSLLDCTLIVAHTEFDRDKVIAYASSGTGGTQHWEYSTSCYFAGMGVNGGRITGDIKKPGLHTAGYSAIGNYRPMPVHASTGAVDSNGTILSSYSIFPTVLSIFGCSSLSQISAGASAIPSVVKG